MVLLVVVHCQGNGNSYIVGQVHQILTTLVSSHAEECITMHVHVQDGATTVVVHHQ